MTARAGGGLIFNGHLWRPDRDGGVYRRAKEAARWRHAHADLFEDDEKRKVEYAWATSSESLSRIEATLSLAKSEHPIAKAGLDWDKDGWLLGVLNGVLDLRTGRLRDGQPEDRITKQAPVEYDPDAQCPLFNAYLERMQPDPVMREWLQRRAGYALTGEVGERDLLFFHGEGANGKTTFTNALLDSLGPDYAMLAAPGLLLQHHG